MNYKTIIRIVKTYVPPESIEQAIDEINEAYNLLNSNSRQKQIEDIVCGYYRIPLVALQGPSRKREVVWARQVMAHCYRKFLYSSGDKKQKIQLKNIGKLLGGRNHATINHAINTVKDLTDVDRMLRDGVRLIESKIRELDS